MSQNVVNRAFECLHLVHLDRASSQHLPLLVSIRYNAYILKDWEGLREDFPIIWLDANPYLS
ncbi:hypothetical protein KIN20_027278 [Parelaphostrongylus tenuis]|uniref:Uncharacterized protein n=1 Tax=Parelaphostrongylus tenuis TaxID=148309 RepID=A0AAD5QZ94_PARTN|nr:hypothetical protein KIN20_027278 [Parelaphostrongylus tenuis]